jgi:hypothetical protein
MIKYLILNSKNNRIWVLKNKKLNKDRDWLMILAPYLSYYY